jgi:hypothetical protein
MRCLRTNELTEKSWENTISLFMYDTLEGIWKHSSQRHFITLYQSQTLEFGMHYLLQNQGKIDIALL